MGDDSRNQQAVQDGTLAVEGREAERVAATDGSAVGEAWLSGRFRLLRRLGSGGMGVVYEASDTVQGVTVALKTLTRVDASALYFLKNEFRSLTDVVHPNLVALHGLFSDGPHWFLTMELVAGLPFVEHVRGGVRLHPPDAETLMLPSSRATWPPDRVAELRDALAQLASGVHAIHEAGKVHRDLKPSNVLVTPEGRVVILDFGLAAEQMQDAVGQTLQGGLLGTPVYMAPEQLTGAPATPASDWYAVGVMLYQSLTGVLPFDGRFHEVFARKQQPPPHPRERDAGVPEDLDLLCVELLACAPTDRPVGAAVVGRLAGARRGAIPIVPSPQSTPQIASRPEGTFVGRAEQLRRLADALATTESGKAAAVLVSGPSGMGKTALVEHFLAGLRERDQAVVLSGRCYERESVAFKALDALIDSLTRYLRRAASAEALLPRDVRALVRVFPVLERVDVILDSPQRRALPADPQELRRRAFGALRELLGRIADRSPLVVFVDDLQWGDVDSAEVLRELLSPPDAPAMLFVGTCRSDERAASPCLQVLVDNPGSTPFVWDEIAVDALPDSEAAELAEQLVGGSPSAALAVQREGRGSPFFITELVRYLEQRLSADDPSSLVLSLERALQRRVSMLPVAAQRALEVVSVAARPLAASRIGEVSELGAEAHAALRVLTSVKLARRVGSEELGTFTTCHDRIREAVAGRLEPSRLRDIHLRLARALEADPVVDLDAVTEHLLAAGEAREAAAYAARAAAQAADGLAFDRAARLFALALEHGEWAPDRGVLLRIARADALVAGGRGAEAAQGYLEAAGLEARAAQASVLRRRAGEQLILAGHLDEGLVMLREAAQELGLELPASTEDAEALIRGAFVSLSRRGYDFVQRPEPEDGAAVPRVDMEGALALAQVTLDSAEGTLWTLRHLHDAIELGDARRVQRGLSLYAVGGGGVLPLGDVPERVEQLAEHLGTPESRGWAHLCRGSVPYWRGEFLVGAAEFERAEQVFRDECRGSAREVSLCRLMASAALWHGEEVRRVSSLQSRCLADARDRKDLYLVTWCHVRAHYTRLAEDQPGLGFAEVTEAVRRWGRRRVDFITWQSAVAFSMLERYRGGDGLPYLERWWPEILRDPGFSRVPVHLAVTRRERALGLLARASRTPEGSLRAGLLEDARKDAVMVARTGMFGGSAFVELVEACAAQLGGDASGALVRLERALEGFAGQSLYALSAATVRRQLGKLQGGEEGAALVAQAERALSAGGVRSVERWARTFLPGFVD